MEPIIKQDTVSGSKPETKLDTQDDLKSLPLPEIEKKLESTPDGLSQADAQKRLTQYGPNEIEESKTNAFLKFLSYFWGPIPWMIEAAPAARELVPGDVIRLRLGDIEWD